MFTLLDLNSIRSRMLSAFLFFTFLILLLAIASLYMLDQSRKITLLDNRINQLQVHMLNIIRIDNDFFDLETINENYFIHHRSDFLVQRDSLYVRLQQAIADVTRGSRENRYPIGEHLKGFDSLMITYNEKFQRLESLLFRRGFKDFGLEGKMRTYAHELEKPATGLAIFDVLTLRRNEKDFLLRHDTVYIRKFNDLIGAILRSGKAPSPRTIGNLRAYQSAFNQLARLQKEIGLTSKGGLRHELNELTTQLSSQYYHLLAYSNGVSTAIQQKALVFYVAMIVGAIVFSIMWAYWVSKRLSEPIVEISRVVKDAIRTNTKPKFRLVLPNAAAEINILSRSFIQLMDQTSKHMREIRKKSKLLKKRNRELKKVNGELDSFLYSTAHDLRSPLSSLHGLINLIRYENKQHELIPYFDMMHQSVARQEDFIAQIVNYSKNKKLGLQYQPLDLRELIHEIFQNQSFVDGASRIAKQIEIKQDDIFVSDKARMQTLFNNLISNAIKYADHNKEHPAIRISLRVSKEEVFIEFADNGLGIESEYVSRIFDMFYRANSDSKGSGLGLFIFKETVKKLRGHVKVESQINVGTTFFLRIPNLLSFHEQLEGQFNVPFASPPVPKAEIRYQDFV